MAAMVTNEWSSSSINGSGGKAVLAPNAASKDKEGEEKEPTRHKGKHLSRVRRSCLPLSYGSILAEDGYRLHCRSPIISAISPLCKGTALPRSRYTSPAELELGLSLADYWSIEVIHRRSGQWLVQPPAPTLIECEGYSLNATKSTAVDTYGG